MKARDNTKNLMKILFIGDYSNLHACLGAELRKRGHEVTIVSDGGRYMDTERDYRLDRQPGRLGSIKYLAHVATLFPKLRGYDVVQLANPHFLSLKPSKIQYFFDLLKRNNGSVFVTLAGNDYPFVKACMDAEFFDFSEFKVGKKDTEFERLTHHGEEWTAEEPRKYSEYFCERIDGAMSVLAEYDMAWRPILGEKVAFCNLPIDVESIEYQPLDLSGKINFFFGIRSGMEVQKGTARLLEMCREIEKELPEKCSVTRVSDVSLAEYLKLMRQSTIVVDQHYSYSPGTNAFQAMAMGKVVATGAQPALYQYMNEPDRGALIPLSPLVAMEEWKARFRQIVLDPSELQEMAAEGRRLVETHNDVRVVATRFERHWDKILNSK